MYIIIVIIIIIIIDRDIMMEYGMKWIATYFKLENELELRHISVCCVCMACQWVWRVGGVCVSFD